MAHTLCRGGAGLATARTHPHQPARRGMHTNASDGRSVALSSRPDINDFILLECIGVGTYGTVYRAQSRADRELVFAIKCIDRSKLNKASQQLVIQEIGIMKTLNNPFVCKMHEFTWDSDKIYLILEYCSGGSLAHFISKRRCLPEALCRKLIQQLACAMKYMRKRNISHFDLKPHNILLSKRRDPMVKVADFGFAQNLASEDGDDMKQKGLRGSPLYMAPEMILGEEYDARVDLWSVGVIWYECLFGRAPFASKTTDELIEKVKGGAEVDLPHVDWLSSGCQQLLRGLLERDPARRLSFEELFAHPYLDLEHMPDSDSSSKAAELIERAVNFDQQYTDPESRQSALRSYCEGLAHLIPLCTYEEDTAKKVILRAEIVRYMKRAEELKHGGCDSPVGPPPPLPNSDPPIESPSTPPPRSPFSNSNTSSTFDLDVTKSKDLKKEETISKSVVVIKTDPANAVNKNNKRPTRLAASTSRTVTHAQPNRLKPSVQQSSKNAVRHQNLIYIDDPAHATVLLRYYDSLERRHECSTNERRAVRGGTTTSSVMTRMQYRAVVAMRDALTTGIIAQKLDGEKSYEEAFDKYQQALDVIISQLSKMPDDDGPDDVRQHGSGSVKTRVRSQAAFWLGRAERLKPFAQLAAAERREWETPPSDLNQLTHSDSSWTDRMNIGNGAGQFADAYRAAEPSTLSASVLY